MQQSILLYTIIFSSLYFAVLIGLQIFVKQKNQGLVEYFLAGRGVGFWAGMATLGATEIGLITIAYSAQKGFNTGFAAFHIGIAALIGCAIIGLTGFIVAPLRRTGVLTIPEFYEKRYGKDVRIFGGLVMAFAGILNMALFLKITALFLTALLPAAFAGVNINILMLALMAIVLLYTCFGGMRIVIATDIVQFILMVSGLAIAAIYLLNIVPFNQAVEVVQAQMGKGGFDPRVSDNYGLDYIIWMVVTAGIVSAAVWPTALSRALCIKDEPTVKKVYLWSSFIFMGRMILPAFLGILAFAYFIRPEQAGQLSQYGADGSLVALAVMFHDVLPPLLLALLTVVMFASFMSTQDGYLFCWASILSHDVVAPLTNKPMSVDRQKFWTRIFIVLIALFEIYWGLIYDGREDIWDYLLVTGSIYFCSAIVVLTAGLYWPRASRLGAILALVAGFSAICSLNPIKLYLGLELSDPMIGFIAISLSVAGMIIGSYLSPLSPKQPVN